MEKIRGTNLGNWLVLEKWMMPEMFESTGTEDETWLSRKLPQEELRAKLKAHRDTYITETDFKEIAEMGLNTVRLPVPYQIFDDRPPLVGCVEYVDTAFDWAEKYGLKILLDLHTVPGSQNGYDNGGITGVCKWCKNPKEVEFALTVLERLAKRYGNREGLFGIEVLNEPISWIVYVTAPSTGKAADKEEAKGSGYVPLSFLKPFYKKAYNKLRAILPDEIEAFIDNLYTGVPELHTVTLGVSFINDLAMADACAIAAIRHGAWEIKAAAYQSNVVSLPHISRLLAAKGEAFGVTCSVRTVEMKRIINQISRICETTHSKTSAFDSIVVSENESIALTANDNMETVIKAVESLGYDLSEEDCGQVWDAFKVIAARKDVISSKELDTIVASAAMQVPATYVLTSYSITASNTASSMAHMKVEKNGQTLEGIALGDGPVDAAFLALENIVGCHYELDDFQVRSVTEGREAMGETVVKLRAGGKIYSGRGTSTDIVGSAIAAYISAINKISYEEA